MWQSVQVTQDEQLKTNDGVVRKWFDVHYIARQLHNTFCAQLTSSFNLKNSTALPTLGCVGARLSLGRLALSLSHLTLMFMTVGSRFSPVKAYGIAVVTGCCVPTVGSRFSLGKAYCITVVTGCCVLTVGSCFSLGKAYGITVVTGCCVMTVGSCFFLGKAYGITVVTGCCVLTVGSCFFLGKSYGITVVSECSCPTVGPRWSPLEAGLLLDWQV